jgi:hypothetical protein
LRDESLFLTSQRPSWLALKQRYVAIVVAVLLAVLFATLYFAYVPHGGGGGEKMRQEMRPMTAGGSGEGGLSAGVGSSEGGDGDGRVEAGSGR